MNDDNIHWYMCYVDMTKGDAYLLDSLRSNHKEDRMNTVREMVITSSLFPNRPILFKWFFHCQCLKFEFSVNAVEPYGRVIRWWRGDKAFRFSPHSVSQFIGQRCWSGTTVKWVRHTIMFTNLCCISFLNICPIYCRSDCGMFLITWMQFINKTHLKDIVSETIGCHYLGKYNVFICICGTPCIICGSPRHG